MKNEKINHLLFWLLVISIVFLLNSCSARKSEVFKKKEASETERTELVEKNNNTSISSTDTKTETKQENTKVISENETVIEETTDTPIDGATVSEIIHPDGTKTIFKNVIRKTKKTRSKNNQNAVSSFNQISNTASELKSNQIQHEKKQSNLLEKKSTSQKEKLVQKEAWSVLNLLWLIVPALLVYYLFKKYQSKIWWV